MNLPSTPSGRGIRRHGAGSVPGLLALAALLVAGCSTADKSFVWADTLPAAATQGPYLVTPGDMLNVRVFNQEGMSGNVRVRPDGMITLPFVNDVEAAGLTPVQLAQRIQARLTEFLVNPMVTVSLQETRPLEISVFGEVQRPGIYRLEPGAGVLTALAAASGFNEDADRDRIFVVRNGTLRIRFTYAALSRAKELAARFRLQPGDVVVVE
jgi:polysaccharide biosynthesis/export protein